MTIISKEFEFTKKIDMSQVDQVTTEYLELTINPNFRYNEKYMGLQENFPVGCIHERYFSKHFANLHAISQLSSLGADYDFDFEHFDDKIGAILVDSLRNFGNKDSKLLLKKINMKH